MILLFLDNKLFTLSRNQTKNKNSPTHTLQVRNNLFFILYNEWKTLTARCIDLQGRYAYTKKHIYEPSTSQLVKRKVIYILPHTEKQQKPPRVYAHNICMYVTVYTFPVWVRVYEHERACEWVCVRPTWRKREGLMIGRETGERKAADVGSRKSRCKDAGESRER